MMGDGAAGDRFARAVCIGIRGIDEIDSGRARLVDDPRRGRLVGRPAEHHGAQTDRRNLEAAAAEMTIFHGSVLTTSALLQSGLTGGRRVTEIADVPVHTKADAR